MPVQAVLFDLDCTITDRRKSVRGAAHLASLKYTLPPSLAAEHLDAAFWQADQWGYRDRREFFQEVIQALAWTNHPPMDELLRFWADDHPTCCVEQEDCDAVLRELRRRGIRTCVVTNGDQRTQSAKIRKLGLADRVDAIVISGELGIRKPDPRIYHHALRLVEVDAPNALFVGDHPENDVAGASAVGIRSVWIEGVCEFPSQLTRPWRTIQKLSELLNFATPPVAVAI